MTFPTEEHIRAAQYAADQATIAQRRICLHHVDHAKTTGETPVYEADFAALCASVDGQMKANAPADAHELHDADLQSLNRLSAQPHAPAPTPAPTGLISFPPQQ